MRVKCSTSTLSISIILLIILTNSVSDSVIIECKTIKTDKWHSLSKNFVVCLNMAASNLIVDEPNVQIDAVETIDNEIEALDLRGAKLKFMPDGIKKKIPKLKAFRIMSSGLTYVDSENMKQFGMDLMYMSLKDNKITVLDADLFQYNLNLKFIKLDNNPLKFIGHDFFTNLHYLKQIHSVAMTGCECMSQTLYGSEGQKLEKFIWLNEKCNDTAAWHVNYLKLPEITRKMRESEKIESLNRKVLQLTQKVENHEKEKEELAVKFSREIEEMRIKLEETMNKFL